MLDVLKAKKERKKRKVFSFLIYVLFTNQFSALLGLKMTQMTNQQQNMGSPTPATVLMSNDCKTSLAHNPSSSSYSVSPHNSPNNSNASYYTEHAKYSN